jgi:predicted site-specific integrase-resolvase
MNGSGQQGGANTYVTSRTARAKLGLHAGTLRRWSDQGLISTVRTPGGKRLYNIHNFITQNISNGGTDTTSDLKDKEKQKICYCRVSSVGQKEDLERQVIYMQKEFPTHRIITDIGSGINFKRKGLCTILELACKQAISEVVVAFRDRLCRFAFELIERILLINGVKLLVLHKSMEASDQSELAEDVLAIINVFNCRVNGRRKYNKRSESKENQQTKEVRETSGQCMQEDPPLS